MKKLLLLILLHLVDFSKAQPTGSLYYSSKKETPESVSQSSSADNLLATSSTTTISFQGTYSMIQGCPPGNTCQFGPEPRYIDNIAIIQTHGCVRYDVDCNSIALSAGHDADWEVPFTGTGIALSYNFKKGYEYEISISAYYDDLFYSPEFDPAPRLPTLQAQLTNNPTIGIRCQGGVSAVNISSPSNPFGEFKFGTNSIILRPSDCYDYLWLSLIPNSSGRSGGYICLFSVTIRETLNTKVTGDNVLCTSNASTYEIKEFGSLFQGSVTWSTSGNITIAGGNTANTVSVKPATGVTRGSGTLKAIVSTPCGNFTFNKTIYVHMGPPIITGISYTYNLNTYPLQEYFTTANNEVCDLYTNVTAKILIQGAAQTSTEQIFATDPSAGWGETAGFPYDTRNVYFDFWGYDEINIFQITASNDCGTTVYKFGFYSWDQCDDQYQVYPNPASNNITVSTKNTSSGKESSDDIENFWENLTIRQVKVLNQLGSTVREQEFGNNTRYAQISVSDLPDGIYYVIITDGKYTETQQVVVAN